MKVIWTPRAMRDLAAQLDYIAQDKPLASARLGNYVVDTVDMLGQWPEAGRQTASPSRREFVIEKTSFVAVYRIEKSTIITVRLLHGAQRR